MDGTTTDHATSGIACWGSSPHQPPISMQTTYRELKMKRTNSSISFHVHNPLINDYAQKSPENLKDMVMMVVLSIQQPWSAVGVQMQDYRKFGAKSRFVWGNKSNTLAWLQDNVESLHADAMEALQTCKGKTLDLRLMEIFIRVDGLGLAKAGFCCQLFAGRVGCIDVRNLRRLSISPTVLKLNKKASKETQEKRIAAYVEACSKRRCSWLWNTWCDLIAKKQPTKWRDGNHVSLVHFEYLKPTGT